MCLGAQGYVILRYPVKIRAKDYLHPAAEALNDMLRVLAEKLERIKQSSEKAMKSLEELEKNMIGGAVANNAYTAFVGAHR